MLCLASGFTIEIIAALVSHTFTFFFSLSEEIPCGLGLVLFALLKDRPDRHALRRPLVVPINVHVGTR